jgi:hypothetical protein
MNDCTRHCTTHCSRSCSRHCSTRRSRHCSARCSSRSSSTSTSTSTSTWLCPSYGGGIGGVGPQIGARGLRLGKLGPIPGTGGMCTIVHIQEPEYPRRNVTSCSCRIAVGTATGQNGYTAELWSENGAPLHIDDCRSLDCGSEAPAFPQEVPGSLRTVIARYLAT